MQQNVSNKIIDLNQRSI